MSDATRSSPVRLSTAGVAPFDDSAPDGACANKPQRTKRQRHAEKNFRKGVVHHAKRSREWGEHPSEDGRNEVHAGSYANPAHRERLGRNLSPGIVAAVAATAGNDDLQSASDPKAEGSGEELGARTKRKFALLLGYLGSDYSGFQMNEGQATVQAELELALVKAKLILPSNFGCPYKYGWSTSGRTDKGVHACAQVVSCKLEVPVLAPEPPGSSAPPPTPEDEIRRAINEQLPPPIRVLDVVRTTRNFCAKTQRHRVRYQYMIPSFLLQDFRSIFGSMRDHEDESATSKNSPAVRLTSQEIQSLQTRASCIRATPDQLRLLRETLAEYQGTHPFHNFTTKLAAQDDRAKRFIESFVAHEPLLLPSCGSAGGDVDALEWIPTTVVGQSFLLHQIRKMIGLAVSATRDNASPPSSSHGLDRLRQALSTQFTVLTPRAPAHGLFLDMSFYDGYNRRKSTNQDLQDIQWDDEASAANARHRDFRGRVLRHIASEEQREGNFLQYMYQEYQTSVRRSNRAGAQPQADDAVESCDSDSNSL